MIGCFSRGSARAGCCLGLLLVVSAVAGEGSAQTVAPMGPPATTSWAPEGCRSVPFDDAAVPSRESWRNLHGDTLNSDEISRAIGPMLVQAWTAEPATYNPTGPVFDDEGNLYFSPYFPYENVVLVSTDPSDGSRRWAIPGTGAPSGASAPMILDDPEQPGEQIVYQVFYDRAVAVRTDGTILWDVPTGLGLGPEPIQNSVLGVNYLPGLDAIVAAARDGFVVALDRATGAPILSTPFSLPGDKSPDLPSALPPAVIDAAEDAWQLLVNQPDGGFGDFVNVLLGQNVEVANMFAVDPRSGRLWVAATAPDAEDGSLDGVSELGALYGLDLVPDGASFEVVEACHASFQGGSASSPALRADGSRVYVGDNFGKLLAIAASDCSTLWEVDLGQQIVGSVAVSSDDDVLYASSRDFITQVFDRGSEGETGWTAGLSGLFDLLPGQVEYNLNLTSIAANGLGFQAGAGLLLNNTPIPFAVGVGVLDRETGAVRHFTAAPEETVAVISSAADGAFYIGNSPVRRAFALALGLSTDPLIGGVTKFAVAREDLLLRDAVCAAEARARNAAAGVGVCQEPAAAADRTQILELIAQAREAGPRAVQDGDLDSEDWKDIERSLRKAQKDLGQKAKKRGKKGKGKGKSRKSKKQGKRKKVSAKKLGKAAAKLGEVCLAFPPAPTPTPTAIPTPLPTATPTALPTP